MFKSPNSTESMCMRFDIKGKILKQKFKFETSIVFPLIQGVMSIIGDIMRDTNDSFNNTFKNLVKVYSV